MKIDRLLGILNILSQAEKVTAPELARRFEVSRRTINRDIEDLCMAGIPVVTQQGAGGGIYIQEGYKLDKSLLKSGELSNIVAALKGLGSVSRNGEIKNLINKIVSSESYAHDVLAIDLSSFYKGSLSDKIEMLKRAVSSAKVVEFTYFNRSGEYKRRIEPYQIIYKWASWYVHGYCLYKNDFRMFKLNRLWDLTITKEDFTRRKVPQAVQDFDAHLIDDKKFEALFDKSVEYLVVETYGPGSYSETDEGKLRLEGFYTNVEYIISWILGFGDKMQILSPPDLAQEIKEIAENIAGKYRT